MQIHWFRRDLRLHDNTALHAAQQISTEIVPVYILSDWKKSHPWTALGRQEFLCGCLAELAENLTKIGGRLIFRRGDAVRELQNLIRETRATVITASRDPDPFGRKTELAVAKMAAAEGCELQLYKDVAIHERDEVRTGSDTIFRVFSPYAKAWKKLEKPILLPPLESVQTPPGISSLPAPTLANWELEGHVDIVKPGETAARGRLDHFLNGKVLTYGANRNLPAIPGGSRLSQDLRWGLLSPREVWRRSADAMEKGSALERKNGETYINELIWREFNLQLLWHYPELLKEDFSPKFKNVAWREDASALEKWQRGETGFPIVDAAIRQLLATGFMHNRLRMIVAMFLTKDLHIHYRHGEQFFAQHLIDGEIASNNGGWQWSAGTGADAAPYFRIQNPWLQTAKFDAEGLFIKTWLPELADVPPEKFAQPPEDGQPVVPGYPLPMVDHHAERDVTLEMFQQGIG